MKKFLLSVFILFSIAFNASANIDYYSSSEILPSKDSKLLFVLAKDANMLIAFDAITLDSVKSYSLPNKPTGMVFNSNQSALYITASMPSGILTVLDLESGKLQNTVMAGHSPCAPTLSHDGNTLLICDKFNNKVRIFDAQTLKELGAISVLREPIAAIFSKDDKKVYVANFMPDGPANKDVCNAKISVVDPINLKYISTIPLDNGAIELYNIRQSDDGKWAFVPHVLARYQVPTSFIERGWIATNAISIIDLEADTIYSTVLVDDAEIGAANPADACVSPDGKTLCVLTSGSHELITMPFESLIKKISERKRAWMQYRQGNRKPKAMPIDDLSFILEFRTRRPTMVNGPRRMAFIGNQLYTVGYFSDEISKIGLYANKMIKPQVSAFGKDLMQMPIARRGERYFHDAAFCFQQWLSCVTCHPDGRTDGLNWDLVNDGVGNPKNTRSMLYSIYNPPVMATGIRPNAEYAIRTGMTHIQFHKLDGESAHGKEIYGGIEAYYRSLSPAPSPYLNKDGTYSDAAARGSVVFAKAGCTACHTGPYYSDLQLYDVGTTYGQDSGVKLKTPILNELWRTAPYMHDGRTTSLKDVITKHNLGKRGNTKSLTEQELNDLVEYLQSL